MFGLDATQQAALVHIFNYLDNYVQEGGEAFPEIPYDLFSPFSKWETEDLIDSMRYTWETGLAPLGSSMHQGWNDGTAQALTSLIYTVINEISAGGGGVVMPSGALGIWYADEYDASARAIPNNAVPAALSLNIIRGSRRLFDNANFWYKLNTAAVDLAATGADSTQSASTMTGTGNWLFTPLHAEIIPAGTYTVAATIKRSGGSDQSFAFTPDFTTTRSATKTATSAYQRFSYTFTRGTDFQASQVGVCSIDGATSATLDVDNVELYAGASDLGPMVTNDGNLYLGKTQVTTAPAVSGNAIDLTTGGYGFIAIPETTSAAFTAMAVLSKTAAGSAFDGFLSATHDFTKLTALVDQSGVAHTYFDGDTAYNFAGLWSLINQGYHMLTHRSDGTEAQLWVDDFLLFRSTKTAGSVAMRDFFMGVVSNTSLGSGCLVNSLALYPTALTDAQIRDAYTVMAARATADGLTMADARVLVQEGDSITAVTSSPQSYSYRYAANQSPKVVGKNIATGGSAVSTAEGRAAALDQVIPPNKGSRKFILSVAVGTNDLMSLGTTPYLTALASYLDDRRAAGWYVVLCTLLPRNQAGFAAARATANAEMRLWTTNGSIVPGQHCDAIVDFDTEATMGSDATATNVTYYSDGLHPTDAGHALLEPVYRAVINAV